MSQVKISGNASGTGVLTISAPNTNTDRTLSLPDNTGDILTTASTVPPKVPLLVAYKSSAAQAVSTATWTKVTYDAEEIDTEGWFASSKYTPQQAGYYSVRAQAYFQFLQNQSCYIGVWRNGSEYARTSMQSVRNTLTDVALSGNCLVHCNGSTDYFEIYVWHDYGSNRNVYNARGFSYLEIMLARTD